MQSFNTKNNEQIPSKSYFEGSFRFEMNSTYSGSSTAVYNKTSSPKFGTSSRQTLLSCFERVCSAGATS